MPMNNVFVNKVEKDRNAHSVFCPLLVPQSQIAMQIGIAVAVCLVLGAILIGLAIYFLKCRKTHPRQNG